MSYRRQDVIERAVDVLDKVGLESLSMRRLGAELGVQPSALYHHVANKQTLLGLMADEILVRGRREAGSAPGRDPVEARGARPAREVTDARGARGVGSGAADGGAPAWDAQVTAVCAGLRAAMLACRDGAEVVATGYAFGYGADAPADELREVLADAGFSDDLVAVGTSTLLHFVFGHTTEEQTTLQADALGAKRAPRPASDFDQGLALIVDGLHARL